MSMTLIATTRAVDMQPLGIGGQRVIDASASILATLRRLLSPAHAALFAEPQPDPERGDIDWYSDGTGPAVVLTNLAEPERATARATLDRLTGDVSALAARLAASAEANDRRMGEMLNLALNVPDPRYITVIDRQPVLIAWGHRAADTSQQALAVHGSIQATRMETPAGVAPAGTVATGEVAPPMAILPPPIPAGVNATGAVSSLTMGGERAWLPLLLAALLLILAVWWLRSDFYRLDFARECRIGSSDQARLTAWRTAEANTAKLNAQLALLVNQVNRARQKCPSPPVAPRTPAGSGT
ncbi:MAG: hypothetical protein PHT60_11560 [Acidiphilium sp.]|nr:hypothetical protein [Acidiphilium sp.]MDD4936400.1 hypothetical protein [Acidiphilium sp.]